MTGVRAVLFDFNGTLSDDEPIMYSIFAGLFAEHGRPLAEPEYFEQLAGLSDPAIVTTWLGDRRPDVDAIVAERVARYRSAVVDGATVREHVRAAVLYAAARVPVGVVSGAARAEIEPVLAAAGLESVVTVLVSSDDVVDGKPHPAGYLRAFELLRRVCGSEPQSPLRPDEVLVFEDTEAGVAAAKAAGMRCVAVEGTARRERLAGADRLVSALDVDVLRRFLG